MRRTNTPSLGPPPLTHRGKLHSPFVRMMAHNTQSQRRSSETQAGQSTGRSGPRSAFTVMIGMSGLMLFSRRKSPSGCEESL